MIPESLTWESAYWDDMYADGKYDVLEAQGQDPCFDPQIDWDGVLDHPPWA